MRVAFHVDVAQALKHCIKLMFHQCSNLCNIDQLSWFQ